MTKELSTLGSVIKTAYEAEANAFTDAQFTKLAGIETAADVTDTANVTAAGALMDSEVDADLKTFALPAGTTISAYGATLVDDADAATARATLDVDQAGTDNSTPPEGTEIVSTGVTDGYVLTADGADGSAWEVAASGTPEGTAILSTGETGGTKVLTEQGDGSCAWAEPSGGGAFEADADTQITPTTPIVLDHATNNEVGLNLAYTTNKAAGDDTGLVVNQTDTASPGTSLLADFQVGGVSKVSITNTGYIVGDGSDLFLTADGTLTNCTWISTDGLSIRKVGAKKVRLDQTGVDIGAGLSLDWTSAAADGTPDTRLYRDAANTLALRNSTNAQTFNCYETWSDASNYSRIAIGGDGTITTEAAGTGTQADIVLNGANRAAHITDVSSGTDTAYETAINAIIAALESHGIAATS